MTHAATEAKLHADLMPLEGVESALVRHMARAHDFAEACFERASTAEAPVQRESELRLATRLLTLFSRALAALNQHRAQTRKDLKAVAKAGQQTQFDQVLHLAALADAAVARKAKSGTVPAGTAPAGTAPIGTAKPPAAAPGNAEVPPLNRQQRRAAERRLRKAGGGAQGP